MMSKPRPNAKVQFARIAASLLLLSQASSIVFAAGPADEAAIRSAWLLYTQQKYAPSADAFEALIRTSTPSSRLYYYAAAANKAAGRIPRARQLCQYVSTNFPKTPEAGYVQKIFPEDAPASASAAPTAGLPAHLKGKSVQELMESEEGRQALKNAMGTGGTAAGAQAGTSTGAASTTSTRTSPGASIPRPRDAVFTAAQVASDGADGITPFVRYPDAGFECSLAALAMLPRGQELIATMITKPSTSDTYMVRFPNSATTYQITTAKMEGYLMKDKALWATLLHGAVRESPVGKLEDGLSLLTGNPADKILAHNTTEQAVATFINEAVKRQHPIVCLTSQDTPSPELVEDFAGYTITGYDPATGMITFRNPHGSNSRRFRLEDDPQHKKFEQLNGGVFKMHVSLFPKYFKEVARSAI